jgi:hypothetical protein
MRLAALLIAIGIFLPQLSQAAYLPICTNSQFSTHPCGEVNTDPDTGQRCYVGSGVGCPDGSYCTPSNANPDNASEFESVRCVSIALPNPQPLENDTQDRGDVTFTPNVAIPGFPTTTPVTGRTAGDYIRALYIYFIGVVGVFAVVMIMYAGYLWITAAGDAGKITQAKEQMNAAVIGLILALTSFLLLQLINPELVKLKSLNLPIVPKILQPVERQEVSEKGQPPVSFDPGTIRNISDYDSLILAAACPDRDLAYRMKALMWIESRGQEKVISPAGAVGLMQMLPSTAGKTIEELQRAEINIPTAAAHLKQLRANTCPARALTKKKSVIDCNARWEEYGTKSCINGDWTYIAAAYNGGLGANCASSDCEGKTWWECEANAGFAETRAYVQKFKVTYDKLVAENALPNCP